MENNNYSEDYVVEEKKFQITRGMVILASIVLIAIIIIIIIIANLINKRKPEYVVSDFTKLEQRMKEEAPTYLSQINTELTEKVITIDLKELLVSNGGAIDSSKGKAAKICEGYVEAYKDDQAIYKPYIKCTKNNKVLYETEGYKDDEKTTTKKTTTQKDTEKPELTVKGEKEITITQGSEYNDEGATAVDNIDGDITSKVKVSGVVDVNVPGEYKITYTASDKAGNMAEATRIIKVISITTTEAKEITTTRKTTAKSYNNTTKKVTTNKITTPPSLTLRGSTYITLNLGTAYNDPGYYASDALGNDITGNVNVSGSVNTNVAGTYTIKYSVKDSYGNLASKTRTIKVINNSVALQGITVTPNNVSISVGKTAYITVGFIPSNASNKSLTWQSLNTKVATVSNGTIKGISKGSTTIIVTGSNNKSAKVTVIVK